MKYLRNWWHKFLFKSINQKTFVKPFALVVKLFAHSDHTQRVLLAKDLVPFTIGPKNLKLAPIGGQTKKNLLLNFVLAQLVSLVCLLMNDWHLVFSSDYLKKIEKRFVLCRLLWHPKFSKNLFLSWSQNLTIFYLSGSNSRAV